MHTLTLKHSWKRPYAFRTHLVFIFGGGGGHTFTVYIGQTVTNSVRDRLPNVVHPFQEYTVNFQIRHVRRGTRPSKDQSF
jgi:hypothetical protein